MARGNPPPLPDDPSDAPPKVAQDEIAAIHGAEPPPPPVFQPPPPPKAPPLPLPDVSTSMSPPPPPPISAQPIPSYTPPPPPQSSSNNNFSAADFGSADVGPVKPDEHWMKAFWRPAMGWLYMIICFMDFVGFPLLTIFLPIIFKPFGLTMPYTAWQSITLANGGLMHLAFGAILGVSAFTRGQEKTAGMMK
jgi:hypothetical protein